MEVEKSIEKLNELLVEHGFSVKKPLPLVAFGAFKEFCSLPVECMEDDVLLQFGVFDFTGESLFYLDFVRQFCIEENGEYSHMEQLHVEFTCKPAVMLANLEASLWAEEYPSLEKYFEHVQALDVFKKVEQAESWNVEIYQEQV
ncbi:hypothetical protein [Alkalimarinus alittae]|uniref:Uncharacterized protein n=1 Tax=Alkalimarinus alittae TaxID=2961619 RepID=A0ABY6N512_9ALTE|nr:hypothetical protein [Alkalimarinus alittae]UZE97211.1 hypothetical protein NKI27_05535 [Alkalimarinus alittae]